MESNKSLVSPLFRFRRAVFTDADFLLELRNDPAVRAVSFSSDAIGRESHLKWLREKVTSPDHLILIGEIDGDPIGQVRIDRRSLEEAHINIALIANFRGRGYGRMMLQKAASIAFSHYAELKRLRAYIKPENSASAKSFSNAGYVFKGTAIEQGHACLEYILNRV